MSVTIKSAREIELMRAAGKILAKVHQNLGSIWETDETTQKFLAVHGRAADYKKLAPADLAYYDGVVEVDLSAIRPMIALPMHPSNAFTIEELNANLEDILHACEQDVQKLIGRKDVSLDLCSKIENGKLRVDQGVIAGCAGGLYDSIYEAASILKGHTGGCGDYALSVYPGPGTSLPKWKERK